MEGSLNCLIKLPGCYLRFASFDAPYNPVCRMHEKRTASIQFMILHLIIQCALWHGPKNTVLDNITIVLSGILVEKCSF